MFWSDLALRAALLASPLAVDAGPDSVKWHFGPLPDALAKAKAQHQLCMIYFWRDGSDYCAKLYEETLQNPHVAPLLGDMVCYSAKHSKDSAPLFERYRIKTLPTMLFVDGSGQPEDVITGFCPADDFIGECERIQKLEGTVTGLRKRLADAQDTDEEIEARWYLAGKLLDVQDKQGHDEHMEVIRAEDPEGETVIGAKLLLSDMVQKVASYDKAKGKKADPKQWDLAPVYAVARTIKPKKVRCDAWNELGNLEAKKGNWTEACAAFGQARKLLADDQQIDWHNDVARWIIEYEAEMTSKERKIAIDYAKFAAKKAKALAKKITKEREAQRPDGEQEKEGMCAFDPGAMQAPFIETLALAYHINRKKDKAVATAKRCLKLVKTEKYEATLAKVAEGYAVEQH